VTNADDVATMFNFKWSRSRGIVGKEEHVAMVLSSAHIFLNGFLFSKVGAMGAATLLCTASASSLLGYMLYIGGD
jgi:hypothetical protein